MGNAAEKRRRALVETATREWREKAKRWVRLMPLAVRAIDGSLRVDLPVPSSDEHFRSAGLELIGSGAWSGAGNPLGPAAFELGVQSREVAAKCAPMGFRVGCLLRFEHRLRRGILPSLAHYMMAEDAEFEIMEIELALGIDPEAPRAINWDEPLNAGPQAVLRALVRNLCEIKVGNLVPQLPGSLLGGIAEQRDKVGQVRRWIDELAARNPPLAEDGMTSGYYQATEKGKDWVRLH